jgi:hypothetical protein
MALLLAPRKQLREADGTEEVCSESISMVTATGSARVLFFISSASRGS